MLRREGEFKSIRLGSQVIHGFFGTVRRMVIQDYVDNDSFRIGLVQHL